MHAPMYNIEPLSLPTHPALAPEPNVVALVENSKATLEERRNATLTLLQILHQATQEITQTDMEVHGSATGET
jgi:hypothetical protein